jgi:NAD(P)-dependent dehydrogenase (short-subunit alcohol dehydrogenase family)
MPVPVGDVPKLFSLAGKVTVVTGAARGNGFSIAGGFIGAGAIVYLLDRSGSELGRAKRRLGSRRARFIEVDVTDFTRMADVFDDVYRREGRLDVLVNNAGVTYPQPSEEYTEENWTKTQDVNLQAPFRLCQLAFPYFKKIGGGVIINVTSIAAELGASNNPAYVASKGGLKQLSKALAKDWACYNIRVNNLCPGYFRTAMTRKSYRDPRLRRVRTERTMLGRWGDGSDLVGPAVFLASDASCYVTGHDLWVDGGLLANGL